MRNDRSTVPRWAQALLAITLLAIAFGVGVLTMTLNFIFGMSRHWSMAIGFMLTDAAKLSLPLAARRFGWTPYFKAAFGLCLVISIYAAISCWLKESGQILIDTGKAETTATAARSALAEAEKKLAELAEPAAPEAIAALIEPAKARLAEMTRAAKAAGIECAQRTKCSEAQAGLARLMERQANAGTRAALLKQRSEALAALETTKETALGAPDYIAAFIGGSRATVARIDNLIGTALFIIAMELLSVLSFYGAALAAPFLATKKEPATATVPEIIRPESGQIACLARLTTLIKNADGGYIEIPHAELSERLRVRPSTLQDWISGWQEAGYLATERGDRGRRRIKLAASN